MRALTLKTMFYFAVRETDIWWIVLFLFAGSNIISTALPNGEPYVYSGSNGVLNVYGTSGVQLFYG